jgi:hypothetical protein
MRLAPIPLASAKVPSEAVRLAGDMSKTTQAAPAPVDACHGPRSGEVRLAGLSRRQCPLVAHDPPSAGG